MSDDLPLPPMAPNMRLATSENFMPLMPDSFKAIEGSDNLVVRELDVARLSGGAVGARVFKALPGSTAHGIPWHWHEWGFQIGYITKGWAVYEFEGVGQIRIEAGTCLFQLPMNRHRELDSSDDFEGIEITFPADVKSTFLIPDEATGDYAEMVIKI